MQVVKVGNQIMERIFFATRAIAENYINRIYPNAEKESRDFDFCGFEDDDSALCIGPRIGSGCGYDVLSDGEVVMQAAWWEEGEDYQIRKNGEVVKTVTYWALARQIMREMLEEEEEIAQEKEDEDEPYAIPEIDCVSETFGIVSVKDI